MMAAYFHRPTNELQPLRSLSEAAVLNASVTEHVGP
jgi:hypothetical protein